MAFFNLFSKKKKETLDQGLEKTKENIFSKLTRAVAGKSRVDDDVLDELEEILVTSDVGVDTTLKIIERIEERVSRDKYVGTDELTRILREEIANLLTENNTDDVEEFSVPAAAGVGPPVAHVEFERLLERGMGQLAGDAFDRRGGNAGSFRDGVGRVQFHVSRTGRSRRSRSAPRP